MQYCRGPGEGRCGAAAGGFDPGQREQRRSCSSSGRHCHLDHLVPLDESNQSLEALDGRLSLPLLTQETLLLLNAFIEGTAESLVLLAQMFTLQLQLSVSPHELPALLLPHCFMCNI